MRQLLKLITEKRELLTAQTGQDFAVKNLKRSISDPDYGLKVLETLNGLCRFFIHAAPILESKGEAQNSNKNGVNKIIKYGTELAGRTSQLGLSYEMCLELIMHCRQSFLQLLSDEKYEAAVTNHYSFLIIRFFDLLEIGIFRHLSKNELSLQKAYFSELLESCHEGIVLLDHNDRVVIANKAFLDLFGYSLKRIKGEKINPIVAPDHLREEAEYLSQKTLYGEKALAKTVRKAKGGNLIPVFIQGYPIKLNGKIVGKYAIYNDLSGKRTSQEKIQHLNLHDPLTGLHNRIFFEQQMESMQKEWPQPMGVIVCDIDGLGIVNNTLGYEKGDFLLLTASEIISDCLRDTDIMSRIGEDEFAILLPMSNAREVNKVLHTIQMALREYNANHDDLPLHLSFGTAVTQNPPQHTVRDLYKEADYNMYREKLHRSQSIRSSIVQTLMIALEERDYITEGHAERIGTLVQNMANAINLSEQRIMELRLLAQFHDIGKVAIPDRILFKEGLLTEEEYEEMKKHSEIGYRIAKSSPDLLPISEWILKHHEWWNGKGYPLGLTGEDIPLECRILAIADAYDAMTSRRPYKKTMTHEEAVAELIRCSGTQFDPHLVKRFIPVLQRYAGSQARKVR